MTNLLRLARQFHPLAVAARASLLPYIDARFLAAQAASARSSMAFAPTTTKVVPVKTDHLYQQQKVITNV